MNFYDTMPFVTADTHYFHDSVIKYCNRPFRSEKDMRRIMIENYNKRVGEDDTCFFVGDVAMIGPSQYEKLTGLIKKLNGHKHLILGNHDNIKPFTYLECGFETVHTALKVEVKINGEIKKFTLAHDPCMKVVIPDEQIMLCGHIHDLFQVIPQKNVVNVGVDVWWYKPISFEQTVVTLSAWKVHHHQAMGNFPVTVPLIDEEIIKPHTEVS